MQLSKEDLDYLSKLVWYDRMTKIGQAESLEERGYSQRFVDIVKGDIPYNIDLQHRLQKESEFLA